MSQFKLTPEQESFRQGAREFAQQVVAPRAAETDRTEQYPWDIVTAMKDAGYFGMTVPEALGGQGRSFLDVTLLIEEMAKVCGVTGRISVEANMGAISAITQYGTEDQKRMAAEMVLSGDKPAICITEPDAGSAATEMTTTAVKDSDNYVLNGLKHWITGGGVSKLHLIFARMIEDGEAKGIGGFIAFRGEEGLVIGDREYAMGLRGIPETRVHFNDLRLGKDRLIVPPEGIKRGFAGLMNA